MKPWQIALILAMLLLGTTMAIFRISKSGKDKIKQFEALSLKPYQDIGGKWTIGWGHLIKPDESHLLKPEGISIEAAELLLDADLSNAQAAVNQLVKVPITGNMYDALVSLVFNIGMGNFKNSTLLKKLNVMDYNGAAAEFPKWKFADGVESAGLLARRAQEQSTFLS